MPIKFLRAYSIYHAGDVVAFAKETADRLVAEGRAVYFTAPYQRQSVEQKMVKKGK